MYRFSDLDGNGHPAHPANESAALPCLIVMDADRRVLQASPGAYRLLEQCAALSLICGTLRAAESSDGASLTAAFHAVLAGNAPMQTLTLGCAEQRIEIQLAPLLGSTKGVIAIVTRPGDGYADRIYKAIRAFELTPAEGRLLERLCKGSSLQQATAQLGVSRNTTRTHLQRIFDKSGMHRQGELIRRVLAS